MYRPNAERFDTLIRIQHRTQTDVNGAAKISYTNDTQTELCAFRGKGGTQNTQSGSLVVEDTAEVTMWYRADLTDKDRLLLDDDAAKTYDMLNIEDVENRHIMLILKVRRVTTQ
jgi:SPP1 family predicted phage head-tail adaptor